MDLDRCSIDRSSMDRSDGTILYLRARIDGSSDITASLFVPAYLRASIDGSSDVAAHLGVFPRAYIDGTSDVYAKVGEFLRANIDSSGDIFAWLTVGTPTVRTITFTGSLAVGKTLVIDGQKFTILNDGVNAIGNFVGDYPVLFPNVNLLKYTDTEGSRTVHIKVIKPGPPITTEIPSTLTLTYTGTLAVGKVLVIEGNDLTVKNDGTNDLAHFTGDFPRIFPGANTITYTDSAGARTMKITVIRNERSV